jgi:AcrR family transcriptional regulator
VKNTKNANSSSKPRTKPAPVRRDELMDAAEHLFVRQGAAATSVDEIVALAGVAKGTFYLHFASKQRLLAALQQRFVTRTHENLVNALDRREPNDWIGRLHVWVEVSIALYLDNADLHQVVFHEFEANPDEPAHDNRVVEELARLIEGARQARVFRAEDSFITATMLFHALHGLVHDSVTGKRPQRQRLTQRAKEFFRLAVGAPS